MVGGLGEAFNILNSSEFDITHLLSVQNLSSFKIEHSIEDGYQYFAPNDQYSFSAFAFVIEKSTNKSIPIVAFEAWNAGPGDFRATSQIASTINLFGSGSAIVEAKSERLYVTISRSFSARAFTYSMFAINWVLTACSIITTTIAFSRESGKRDVGITLLPITAILAIPAIRNFFVGSPPFGIHLGAYEGSGAASRRTKSADLDIMGIFPQMLIVVLCTVVVLSFHALSPRIGTEQTMTV